MIFVFCFMFMNFIFLKIKIYRNEWVVQGEIRERREEFRIDFLVFFSFLRVYRIEGYYVEEYILYCLEVRS